LAARGNKPIEVSVNASGPTVKGEDGLINYLLEWKGKFLKTVPILKKRAERGFLTPGTQRKGGRVVSGINPKPIPKGRMEGAYIRSLERSSWGVAKKRDGPIEAKNGEVTRLNVERRRTGKRGGLLTKKDN